MLKIKRQYQSYYVLKGEDYEDKCALLSAPTKLGVGLITTAVIPKPQQRPLCLHNTLSTGRFIVLCKSYWQFDAYTT